MLLHNLNQHTKGLISAKAKIRVYHGEPLPKRETNAKKIDGRLNYIDTRPISTSFS